MKKAPPRQRKSRENPEVREFILRHIAENPNTITALAMEKFDLSRTTVNRYLDRLQRDGLITAKGNTYARHYSLKILHGTDFTLSVDGLWSEDDIWRQRIRPLFKSMPENITGICQYGFTEMLNNVIDHARSPTVDIFVALSYGDIVISIVDRGWGIFEKIQHDFKLDDPRSALLELSKGKLTSDRRNHSGEGIYFTSRMFDQFMIRSGHLVYSRLKREEDDWLIEVHDEQKKIKGTDIFMRLRTDATWTTQEVFDRYLSDNWKFRKTHVPLSLAQYPGEMLVSRSQAKRLLSRFESFSEVFLDFSGVDHIGQGFADEIFRVFRNENPTIKLTAVNANDDVQKMIRYVTAADPDIPPEQPLS